MRFQGIGKQHYVGVISPKALEQAIRLEIQAGFLCCSLEAEVFLLLKTSVIPLKPSTDCLRSTYIMEGNLFYSKSIYLNVIHI